ncbi:MAG TPA: IS66 family transposase [Terriglobia bacterium]|nr:IS66 family transposase [Terriglobia bacterium]
MNLSPEAEAFVASLMLRLEALEAENADLRRRLGLDSSNSSKPPSSDGLKKKPRVLKSLRNSAGRPSGGQKGHRGETLRQTAEPDRIVEHRADRCGHCQARLLASSKVGEETRQVFDLPEKLMIVTEHRAAIHDCASCRRRTRADFPEGIVAPAQYGERVRATGVYLNAQQLVPEERTARVLADLFGARACGASVARWVRAKAETLAAVHRRIGECVAAAPVRCLDETGFRIAGQTRWLHTASTATHTFYRAGEPRSAVLECRGGVVVHDHWRAYYGLENVDHAFCNAHLLRELQAVCELDKEPWAEALRATLLNANEAVRAARTTGAAGLAPETIKGFEERYWAAVREGLALHRSLPAFDPSKNPKKRKKQRPAHNLLIRFKTFKEATLRFLANFAVPFTNNLAEQDLRMMKVKAKISGGFRTPQGAIDFARLRSVISSARKQGFDILKAMTLPPESLASQLGL